MSRPLTYKEQEFFMWTKQLDMLSQRCIGMSIPSLPLKAETVKGFIRELEEKREAVLVMPQPYPFHSSHNNLSKIFLKDLRLGVRMVNKYLMLRSCTPPASSGFKAMGIVEDEKGSAIMIQIMFNTGTDGMLYDGNVLVVKEPLLYMYGLEPGEVCLRVDHPTDKIALLKGDESIVEAFRHHFGLPPYRGFKIGSHNDHHFQARHIICLQKELARPEIWPERRFRFTLELVEALLSKGIERHEYALALLHSLHPLNLIPTPSDTRRLLEFRARALMGLRRWRGASEAIRLLLKKYPEHALGQSLMQRCIASLIEAEKGKYKWQAIRRESVDSSYMDHADFKLHVEVRKSVLGGFGLFLTRDVQVGELLLVEKAFAIVFEKGGSKDVGLHLPLMTCNLSYDHVSTDLLPYLITRCVSKLAECKYSEYKQFSELYAPGFHRYVHSTEEMLKKEGHARIDSFQVAQVIAFNAITNPLSSGHAYHGQLKKIKTAQGIWLIASNLNHSCSPNTRHSFVGDLMIVRAAKPMPAGTELSIWYREPDDCLVHETTSHAPDRFEDWEFVCKCCVCADEDATRKTLLAQRNKIAARIKEAWRKEESGGGLLNVPFVENLLLDLEKTYNSPPIAVPRYPVAKQRMELLHYLIKRGTSPKKVIDTAIRTLFSLGFIIADANDISNADRTEPTPSEASDDSTTSTAVNTPGTEDPDGSDTEVTLLEFDVTQMTLKGLQFPAVPYVKSWGLFTNDVVGIWWQMDIAYGKAGNAEAAAACRSYVRLASKICFGMDEN